MNGGAGSGSVCQCHSVSGAGAGASAPPHMGNTACTRHRARAQSIAQDEESVMFAPDELIDESALIRYLSRDMLYILNSFDYPFKIHSLTTPKFKLDAR